MLHKNQQRSRALPVHRQVLRWLSCLAVTLASIGAIELYTPAPAHAAVTRWGLPASGAPITYHCTNNFSAFFGSCGAADHADLYSLKAGNVHLSRWSLQRVNDASHRRYLGITNRLSGLCEHPAALACATTPCSDNSSYTWCHILVVTDAANWYTGLDSPPYGKVSLLGVLVHEKLHWAGCDHSSVLLGSDARHIPSMRSGTYDGDAERSPQQDDVNCIKSARLDGSRDIASNGDFEDSRSQFGGVDYTTWNSGGTGGNGPTLGMALRQCGGYGYGSNCGMVTSTGTGVTGPINIHQELSDLGEDYRSLYFGFKRKVDMVFQVFGFSWINIIVVEGPPPSNQGSSVVLANTYCSYDSAYHGRWWGCSTPEFRSTTGYYTVYIYNASVTQSAGQTFVFDNIQVKLSYS